MWFTLDLEMASHGWHGGTLRLIMRRARALCPSFCSALIPRKGAYSTLKGSGPLGAGGFHSRKPTDGPPRGTWKQLPNLLIEKIKVAKTRPQAGNFPPATVCDRSAQPEEGVARSAPCRRNRNHRHRNLDRCGPKRACNTCLSQIPAEFPLQHSGPCRHMPEGFTEMFRAASG